MQPPPAAAVRMASGCDGCGLAGLERCGEYAGGAEAGDAHPRPLPRRAPITAGSSDETGSTASGVACALVAR
jgi:hypothetical protein